MKFKMMFQIMFQMSVSAALSFCLFAASEGAYAQTDCWELRDFAVTEEKVKQQVVEPNTKEFRDLTQGILARARREIVRQCIEEGRLGGVSKHDILELMSATREQFLEQDRKEADLIHFLQSLPAQESKNGSDLVVVKSDLVEVIRKRKTRLKGLFNTRMVRYRKAFDIARAPYEASLSCMESMSIKNRVNDDLKRLIPLLEYAEQLMDSRIAKGALRTLSNYDASDLDQTRGLADDLRGVSREFAQFRALIPEKFRALIPEKSRRKELIDRIVQIELELLNASSRLTTDCVNLQLYGALGSSDAALEAAADRLMIEVTGNQR